MRITRARLKNASVGDKIVCSSAAVEAFMTAREAVSSAEEPPTSTAVQLFLRVAHKPYRAPAVVRLRRLLCLGRTAEEYGGRV
mmetsp:Transcript_115/g.349  ORF Transcript_115/g.349 Transcript_115/m.349 type:complete len:83 (-) Transcript_115:249-497(-)